MKSIQVLSLILFVFLVIAELFPTGVQNMALYAFLLWLLTSRVAFPIVFRKAINQRRYIFLILFLAFYFLSTTMGKGLFQGFVFTLYMMRVVSPILMYDILRISDKKTQKTFVFTLIIIFIAYASWMYRLIEVYGAELGIKSSILGTESDNRINSAFGFIYSLPIIMVSLILAIRSFLKLNNRRKDIFEWVRIVFCILVVVYFSRLVFKSLFMTATVLLVLGICLGIFYNRGKGWVYKSAISIFLASVIFVSQYDFFVSNVSELGSRSTDQRVEEVYLMLTGKGSQAEDISSRSELSNTSLKTFFNHPLIGANHLIGFERYNNKIIGNHAEWIDMLALYGLFALLLFYVLYKSLKLQYLDTGSYLPVIIYVLTGFLNPMFYFTVNLAVFVIAPLLSPKFKDGVMVNE